MLLASIFLGVLLLDLSTNFSVRSATDIAFGWFLELFFVWVIGLNIDSKFNTGFSNSSFIDIFL